MSFEILVKMGQCKGERQRDVHCEVRWCSKDFGRRPNVACKQTLQASELEKKKQTLDSSATVHKALDFEEQF